MIKSETYCPDDILLQLEDVSKYRSGRAILSHATLTIRKNRIIGVLGENGIGKTTLLKVMAGLLKPDQGSITKMSGSPSFLVSASHFYEWMTVADSIQFFSNFFDDFDRERASLLTEQSEISGRTRISHLSGGQQERLCIILGLCRKSSLYLFDEPFGSSDPLFKKDMKRFLLENMADNSTIVMATHLLKDLEYLFDEIILLTESEIRQTETEYIRSRYHKSVEQYYLEEVSHE